MTTSTASKTWAVCAGVLLSCACGEQQGLPADSSPGVRYPIALTATPDGKQVLAIGANFDRKFRAGSIGVIDTASQAWQGKIAETEGFAGGAALQLAATGGQAPLRLLITSREHDALALMDVSPVGGGVGTLTCGGLDSNGRCGTSHHYGKLNETPTVGDDPMGIEVLPWGALGWRVHVAATLDGRVSVLRLDAAGKLNEIGSTGFGSGLSHIRTVAKTGRTYISDNKAPQLHVFRLDPDVGTSTGWKVVPEASVSLPAASARDHGRGMAISGDGARLYVASRSPESLLLVDVAPDSSGVPRNQVTAVIPLVGKPSEVAVAPSGSQGKELVYVSCYGDDAVWVVDPWLRSVVDVIRLPHAPYALTVAKVPGLDAVTGAPRGWTLYAGLFSRHAIVAVPLEPGHPMRHRMAALLESE